jgi:hypothetical protein
MSNRRRSRAVRRKEDSIWSDRHDLDDALEDARDFAGMDDDDDDYDEDDRGSDYDEDDRYCKDDDDDDYYDDDDEVEGEDLYPPTSRTARAHDDVDLESLYPPSDPHPSYQELPRSSRRFDSGEEIIL